MRPVKYLLPCGAERRARVLHRTSGASEEFFTLFTRAWEAALALRYVTTIGPNALDAEPIKRGDLSSRRWRHAATIEYAGSSLADTRSNPFTFLQRVRTREPIRLYCPRWRKFQQANGYQYLTLSRLLRGVLQAPAFDRVSVEIARLRRLYYIERLQNIFSL